MNEAARATIDPAAHGRRKRVLLLGATGTIGRAAAAALARRGHETVCLVRGESVATAGLPAGVEIRTGEAADPDSLARDGFRGEHFHAVVSCLASRTGSPGDAWKIDHLANSAALAAAKAAGCGQFVLLSAICVQRPVLAFQHAKLAFEKELRQSGIGYSIVRPTAFFKSLSGQAGRVRAGKPFLVFGDGRLTACKPISDRDTGEFLADCLDDPGKLNAVLPVGGPGPAITPLEQGEMLFSAFAMKPRFRHVPVALLDAIVGGLALAGRFSALAAQKAELARIGRYYATESMLLLDPATGRYSADLTPSFGSDRLCGHYARLARGEAEAGLGEHAVF